MSTVLGRAFGHLSTDRVATHVDELLAAHAESVVDAESLVLLPSAHYPYHPSTGLVTNPTVVAAAATSLDRLVDPDRLTVAIPGSSWADAALVSDSLGYPAALAGTPADLVHLADADARRRVSTDGERPLSIHPVLEESVVVTVPTLRRSGSLGLDAGLATLAWAMTTDPDAAAVAAAADLVTPAVTLLDGTYVFDGTPSKPAFLLASDDGVALDLVCAALLEVDADTVPYLAEAAEAAGDPAELLEGVRLESIRADVRSRSTSPAAGTGAGAGTGASGDLVAAGYRLYSRLSGDLLPPQLLGGADE